MSEVLAPVLFQSATRSAVLELLFVRGVSASVSELARRAGLSARSVGNEVRHLLPTGLVVVEAVGGADVVRANTKHAGARHLRGLLTTPAAPEADASEATRTRESLVAWGAPLAGTRGVKHFPLAETLLRALVEARQDASVLRVLPLVLARHAEALDWPALREDARRRKLKAELGLLVELTAELTAQPGLLAHAAPLRDRRRRAMRFYPVPQSRYEAELARQRTPDVARRWGFWMNMSLESFRAALEKHRA